MSFQLTIENIKYLELSDKQLINTKYISFKSCLGQGGYRAKHILYKILEYNIKMNFVFDIKFNVDSWILCLEFEKITQYIKIKIPISEILKDNYINYIDEALDKVIFNKRKGDD